ncbi:hypothetical protein FHS18_005512 [Paenibacillus phyllosphaerae]|uniref:Uncharacterized protein n=1 Tax=Paenibacillus phyllosphaerae TaxID=274593 RepID=A0A7W5B2U2_9BACL|nr:hypothetical protein [Paenibacillus phyllosphaerae]MBB3113400.1 hypothetical protein [Paenibacillus phyllosphaerae]
MTIATYRYQEITPCTMQTDSAACVGAGADKFAVLQLDEKLD